MSNTFEIIPPNIINSLCNENESISETRAIEELGKIRVALVKRGDERPNFVFENMDLDQTRLFAELRLDSVLKESKVTV